MIKNKLNGLKKELINLEALYLDECNKNTNRLILKQIIENVRREIEVLEELLQQADTAIRDIQEDIKTTIRDPHYIRLGDLMDNLEKNEDCKIYQCVLKSDINHPLAIYIQYTRNNGRTHYEFTVNLDNNKNIKELYLNGKVYSLHTSERPLKKYDKNEFRDLIISINSVKYLNNSLALYNSITQAEGKEDEYKTAYIDQYSTISKLDFVSISLKDLHDSLKKYWKPNDKKIPKQIPENFKCRTLKFYLNNDYALFVLSIFEYLLPGYWREKESIEFELGYQPVEALKEISYDNNLGRTYTKLAKQRDNPTKDIMIDLALDGWYMQLMH